MDSSNRMINADCKFSSANLFHNLEARTAKKMNNNTKRNPQIESLCDFSVVGNSQKERKSSKSTGVLNPMENINSERRDTNLTNEITWNSAQETKKQKLKGGKTGQIPSNGTSLSPHIGRTGIMMQRKPKMMLTRPKEPKFKTTQRVHSAAQTPKIDARPLNGKSAETTSVALAETTPRNNRSKPHLTTPKIPRLQTSFRTRLLKINSSQELEKEQQDKASTFKARPLNKKILESKGELGLFCNKKRQVTVPREFHFSIYERIPQRTPNNTELFDKIASCLESHNKKLLIPKKTIPRPFHLQTEKRGERRESKPAVEFIPKSNPYPCATDHPVVSSKTVSRHRTKLEPFQVDSLVRHEKEDVEASMRIVKAEPVLKEDPIPVPERVRRPLTEVQEFNLHVEQRAIDITESGKKFKEKVMMEEENVLKQLKKTLKRHARQVPSFEQPFSLQKSLKGITKSSSPSSNVCVRKDGRRNLAVATATSSAASNMR